LHNTVPRGEAAWEVENRIVDEIEAFARNRLARTRATDRPHDPTPERAETTRHVIETICWPPASQET